MLRPHSATRAAPGVSQRGPGWALLRQQNLLLQIRNDQPLPTSDDGAPFRVPRCSMRRRKKVLTAFCDSPVPSTPAVTRAERRPRRNWRTVSSSPRSMVSSSSRFRKRYKVV